jgi:hypothetical protein
VLARSRSGAKGRARGALASPSGYVRRRRSQAGLGAAEQLRAGKRSFFRYARRTARLGGPGGRFRLRCERPDRPVHPQSGCPPVCRSQRRGKGRASVGRWHRGAHRPTTGRSFGPQLRWSPPGPGHDSGACGDDSGVMARINQDLGLFVGAPWCIRSLSESPVGSALPSRGRWLSECPLVQFAPIAGRTLVRLHG